jgi:hypothetical protein
MQVHGQVVRPTQGRGGGVVGGAVLRQGFGGSPPRVRLVPSELTIGAGLRGVQPRCRGGRVVHATQELGVVPRLHRPDLSLMHRARPDFCDNSRKATPKIVKSRYRRRGVLAPVMKRLRLVRDGSRGQRDMPLD